MKWGTERVRVDINCCLQKGLNDPSTNEKSCWSVLKRFCNERKISLFPSLLINNNFVTDFEKI